MSRQKDSATQPADDGVPSSNGRLHIPREKLWYLLLDKSVHEHNDPTYFDTRNLVGKKINEENGYLGAMQEGWDLMINSVNQKESLSSDLLLKIHEMVRPTIKIPEEYRMVAPELRPPEYRATQKAKGFSGAGMYSINLDQSETLPICTEAAKREWSEEKLIFDVRDDPISDPEIHNQYLAFLIRGTDLDMSSHFPSVEDFLKKMHTIQLGRELTQNELEKIGEFSVRFNKTRCEVTQEESSNRIVSLSGLPVGQFEQKRKVIELANNTKRPLIDKLIAEYNQNLDEVCGDNEKKLLAIVRFIRKISIAHPFTDCNQRVFVFLILNKLLLENNFFPVILENPYVFDGYLSAAELVREVKQGFKNFLKIVHGDEIQDIDRKKSIVTSPVAFFNTPQIDLQKYPQLVNLNKIDLSKLSSEQLTLLNEKIRIAPHIADLIIYKHLTVEEACNLTDLRTRVLSNQHVYDCIVLEFLKEKQKNIPISDILRASDNQLSEALTFVESPGRKSLDEYVNGLKNIFPSTPSAAPGAK